MNIDAVISQVKLFAPVFNGNVAGAAMYARAVADQGHLNRPACYIIPVSDEAEEPNPGATGVFQTITETIGVIVDIENGVESDRRNQAAATAAVNQYRTAIWKALIGWRYDSTVEPKGFYYSGGALIAESMSRARLMWQYDFAVKSTLTPADGWSPASEPLISIRGTVILPGQSLPVSQLIANVAKGTRNAD